MCRTVPLFSETFNKEVSNVLCEKPIMLVELLLELRTDHFTVVGLATRPLNGSEAGIDLVLIQTSLLLLRKLSCLMLTSWHLHEKSREVCIKARSPPA